MGPGGRAAVAAALLGLTAVSGCGTPAGAPADDSSASAAHQSSGVRGIVLLRPTCGGARRCPDRAVMRTITAREVGGRGAGSTTSGADGHFELYLPPGRFRLRTNTPEACPVSLVTVTRDRFSRVRIICESGLV